MMAYIKEFWKPGTVILAGIILGIISELVILLSIRKLSQKDGLKGLKHMIEKNNLKLKLIK